MYIYIYISVILSTKLRGLFDTANETFVTVGISINYALGAIHNFLLQHCISNCRNRLSI